MVGIVVAIGWGGIKKWWVPGFVYDREVERGDELAEELKRSVEVNLKLAKALAEVQAERRRRPPGA